MATTKMVQFDTVEIRYYKIVLSDNPGCELAPAIELGWDYEQTNKMKLNTWQLVRGNKKRRLYMSPNKRTDMLLDANYTKDELKMAMRRKNNIIRARHRNNYLMNPVSKLQMKMAHEIRLKKIYMATKNLKSIEGDSLFHEHSDIYEGWYKPDITLGSKENQERIDEIEAKYTKRQ